MAQWEHLFDCSGTDSFHYTKAGCVSLIQWYNSWKRNQNLKQAEKWGKTLSNKLTVKDQRQEALDGLAALPPEIAIPNLLRRFEMSTDHGIQDTREKERVIELITEWEEFSKPFVETAVKKHLRVSWAIRAAEKILDLQDFLKLLVDSLHTEEALFEESIHERNIEILLALKDYSDPIIVKPAFTLVQSRNENVRIAALECLEAQAEHNQEARQLLKNLSLQEPNDMNSRIVGIVKSMLDKHSWVES